MGGKGRSQKKTDCRYGFPDPDLLKEKNSGTSDETSKSYRAAKFWGAILESKGRSQKKTDCRFGFLDPDLVKKATFHI